VVCYYDLRIGFGICFVGLKKANRFKCSPMFLYFVGTDCKSALSGISHYNRMEKGEREVSVKVLERLAKLYGMTIDQIVNMNNDIPQEVVIEDKTAMEQMRLIAELDEKDKSIVFAIIDKMLTTKKFKDFFAKNVAML
jgi:transcriptional regulator with XRE-family HTH domain